MKTRTTVAIFALVALSITAGMALAQDVPLGRLQPLLVDIQQQIPVDVTFVIDGSAPQTVTVPMALDLNLQISLSSSMTPVITLAPAAPIIQISAPIPDQPTEDALGLTYILAPQPAIEITEWTAFSGESGNLQIAGELKIAPEAAIGDNPEFVLRIYGPNDRLIDVVSDTVPMYDPQPGDTNRFKIITYIDVEDIDRYTVEIITR